MSRRLQPARPLSCEELFNRIKAVEEMVEPPAPLPDVAGDARYAYKTAGRGAGRYAKS